MSKELFTSEEIELLSKNKYVKNVTDTAITYTDELKILFIAERSKGKLPIHIFQDARFDIDGIGNNRIWCVTKRWRNSYN